ncbi:MAG: DNA mismatch repair endonuclease MutL [Clostridiales bacterium]|nr:DNA mismatch repair endonuclease MutL [Clostridiales bacterium]
MNKIQLLPPDVAQKIAAGEVIERPFSVVKELVENSLDAGATEISIELQEGGKRYIKVQDNGLGMSREDATLCFERHATSKISTESDLGRIATLGFRGEALASISAVSRLTLKTSDGEGVSGTRVEREGGELRSVQDVAFPRGTSVELRDLFFNLPARRKFLRSEKSELGMIVRWVTGVALAYPETRFSLVHSRREILTCPAVGSVRERIFQLFGKTVLDALLEINLEDGEIRVSGFGSRPPQGRPDRTHQLFFVNRRLVKDRVLQAALNQAYRGLLEKDSFPQAFLFLAIPASDVDVNVHPAKAEIRFRDSQLVFYVVLKAVEKSMHKEEGIKLAYPVSDHGRAQQRVEEPRSYELVVPGGEIETRAKEVFPLQAKGGEGEAGRRVLGQYLEAYIVAADEEGLLVIDQHNAHERVLFEKYREIDSEKSWPQKVSLIPVLFDLAPSQELSLEENREVLEAAGFKVDAMGGRTFALNGFPDIFDEDEAKNVLFVLLEEMGGEEMAGRREKLLATLACRTAVKAGERLTREKMDYLVEELFRTSNPSLCPHGRPVVLRIEKSQIEKGLKRPS